MLPFIEAFDPAELVVLVVALVGLLPTVAYYRDETRYLTIAYACLLFGAVATTAEAVVLPDLLNFAEHLFGILGAGVMFAVAAYMRRKNVIEGDDLVEGDDAAAAGVGE